MLNRLDNNRGKGVFEATALPVTISSVQPPTAVNLEAIPVQDGDETKSAAEDRRYTTSDNLTLHYVFYPGPAERVPVVCLPGLTRNARDFAGIAKHLSAQRCVYCLEFRGRGRSQWDANPSNYQAPVYVADTLGILAQEKLDRVIVLGTSLGGIIGTGVAQVNPSILAGIVLNDIGPEIDPSGLVRIGSYLGHGDRWKTWDEAVATLKAVNTVVYPDFTDQDWLSYARKTCRENEDGLIAQDYDPALSQGFAADSAANVDLWPVFDALEAIPALLIRGALSDLLSAETADKMVDRLPNLELETIANRGHVPTLEEPASLSVIEAFVAKVDTLDRQSS
ncbi:MAG: alpha/beta hydrolase [Rhodospirillaceae bacterium]|jgi:pimeloyl-ACP methyl ester carboxylesterase|nr:alpha/beta hydrolase [Rhodospirillaceae bacterium]MBT5566741.1 alpha/beta hydrolase [Rhodospirillaceae bacterium]MBT6090803.1 alpha/beta hydrolase [Rhodospirillaceae bacterium]